MLQALLGDVRELVGEARWGELDDALQRIQGPPNNLESNVRDAAYSEHSAPHGILPCPCADACLIRQTSRQGAAVPSSSDLLVLTAACLAAHKAVTWRPWLHPVQLMYGHALGSTPIACAEAACPHWDVLVRDASGQICNMPQRLKDRRRYEKAALIIRDLAEQSDNSV